MSIDDALVVALLLSAKHTAAEWPSKVLAYVERACARAKLDVALELAKLKLDLALGHGTKDKFAVPTVNKAEDAAYGYMARGNHVV